MRRGTLTLLVLLVLGALAGLYTVLDSLRRSPDSGRQPPESQEVPATSVPTRGAQSQGTPTAIAISGYIVGRDASSLPGIDASCGDDSVTSDSAGAFRFPERLRGRSQKLLISKSGREIVTWNNVLTGPLSPNEPQAVPSDAPAGTDSRASPTASDPAGAAGGNAPSPLAELPATPGRIRWTLSVLQEGGLAPDAWIGLDAALCEDWGERARIRFRGTTRLPSQIRLAASLYFDGCRILAATETAEVHSGVYEGAILTPPGFRLFSGVYTLEVEYSAVLQNTQLLLALQAEEPEANWMSLEAGASSAIFLGDPSEAAEEDRAVALYYGRMIDEAARLDRAMKSGVEEVLELLRGWDPAQLKRLLDQGRFEEIVSRSKNWDPSVLSTRRAAREGWYYRGFVENGDLREDRWRKFVDEEWRPAATALRDQHAARGQEKYPEAAGRLSSLLSALLAESYALSSFVVYPPYLRTHPNDFYPDEEKAGDLPRLERILRDNFAELERYRRLPKP